MEITRQTKENAHAILNAMLANPKITYANNGGIIKLPPRITEIAIELALQMDSDFNCMTNRIDKRRKAITPLLGEMRNEK
jgi:hypothetical protein